MRTRIILLVAGLAACTTPPPPGTSDRPIPELAGRTAGTAARCVTIVRGEPLRVANGHTVLYGHGGTVWMNRMQDNCGSYDPWDVLVTEPIGSQHCQGDLVRSFDPTSRLPGPTCRLGAFVPFTRG